MKTDAVLVDAGTGNLHSVQNALQAVGYSIMIASKPEDLRGARRIILPGVGAFGSFMGGLQQRNLIELLRELARRGTPLLGICVGMQALLDASAENGVHPGLGLIPGQVRRLPAQEGYKIPHTGWNQLWPQANVPLFAGIPAGSYAYFNHAYFCEPADPAHIICTTDYNIWFASTVNSGNLYGVQFHPEKSQQVGQRVLQNFMKITL